MIFPNKFIKFEESTLFKMLSVLNVCRSKKNIEISELYSLTEHKFNCIDEFLYSIEVLHILDAIEVDFNNETVFYAKKD